MKLHVLVVDEDSRVNTAARDAAVYLERGARIHNRGTGHRIEHRADGVFFVVEPGAPHTAQVNGIRVDAEQKLTVGDRIETSASVAVLALELRDIELLRHDAVELANSNWIAFGLDSFARDGRRRAYSRVTRATALIDRSPPGAVEPTPYARAAGAHRSLPGLVDLFTVDGVVHRAYDCASGIDLNRFANFARPCPPQVAARILDELLAASAILAAERALAPRLSDILVGFDGSLVVAPRAPDPDRDLTTRAHHAHALLAVAREVIDPKWPPHPERLESLSPQPFRDAVASFVRTHEPASDEELASVVAGLFPDELAAELQLREELACIDPSIRAMPAGNRGDRS